MPERPIDLELVAQRILKLAEVAALEHLEMLLRSQAAGMIAITGDEQARLHAEA